MRLVEYIIALPADLYDTDEDFQTYAVLAVREMASDYCVPCTWDVWLLHSNSWEVTYSVTRLSNGGAFPDNYQATLLEE